MLSMNSFERIHILKILIPFVMGILVSIFYHISSIYYFFILIACCVTYFSINKYTKPTFKISKNSFFYFPLFISFFSIGAICSNYKAPTLLPQKEYKNHYAIAIIEKIKHKDFSSNLQLFITECIDSCGNQFPINQRMTAWMEGNNYSLFEGNTILLKFAPQPITNSGNPEEFDYATYQKNKGILYHLFINRDEYRIIGYKHNQTSIANRIQQYMVECIQNSSLSPDAKSFFITIILGDTSFLDSDTRELFSFAGISHILALSGLHICILYLLLSLLFFPLDYFGYKRIRLFITLLTLICFSFIIGFPTSVTRACIMIGFIIISRIIYRKNSSLNALFASAILILFITPSELCEIGFQLSFLSVLLILLLYKKLNIFSPKQELLYHFYSLITISIITSFGTMALSAYYFNYISFASLFTNFLIVPMLPIIIGCGIIYTLLLCCGIDIYPLSIFLNKSYFIITDISSGFYNIPYSYINNVYVSSSMLFISLIGLISIILFFIHRKRVIYIITLICSILSMTTLNIIEKTNTPHSGFVIFHDFKQCNLMVFNNGIAELLYCNDSFDLDDFKSCHHSFLSKYNINNVISKHITSDTHLILGDKKVAIISSNTTHKTVRNPIIDIDYILISGAFYGTIKDIMLNYNPQKIIFSGNIHHLREIELIQECIQLSIPARWTKSRIKPL